MMQPKMNFVACAMLLMFAATVQCRNVDIESNDIEDGNDGDDGAYYQGVLLFATGRECAMVGGLCVQQDDCMAGHNTFMKGLCPDREIGVECCYRVTPRPSTCAQQQGECMDDCNPSLQRDIATDCGPDQKCCVLV